MDNYSPVHVVLPTSTRKEAWFTKSQYMSFFQRAHARKHGQLFSSTCRSSNEHTQGSMDNYSPVHVVLPTSTREEAWPTKSQYMSFFQRAHARKHGPQNHSTCRSSNEHTQGSMAHKITVHVVLPTSTRKEAWSTKSHTETNQLALWMAV